MEASRHARGRAGPFPRGVAWAAARFIERHATDHLTLDTVAAEAGLSAFHFVRVFRAALGVTPHQYLMRVRLLRAIALLRDTALPVTEVAYEAGWSDLSTFNRTFRRRLGCTPLEFRRRGDARRTTVASRAWSMRDGPVSSASDAGLAVLIRGSRSPR